MVKEDSSYKLDHFIESQQLNLPLIYSLFERVDTLRKGPHPFDYLRGKSMVTLFYEPSTRTRLSFEFAMRKMGGDVSGTDNAGEFSSAVKGESIEDTIRVVDGYCDCIVLRHTEEGSAKRAAAVSKVPIINAGDGKGQHPTQSLLDIYTIYKEIGRLDNLHVAMVGDLAYGRTVKSLCYLLGKFDNITITFVSPENLRILDDIKEYLQRHNVQYKEATDLNPVLPEADIVYMTRIQKERMNAESYELAQGKCILDMSNLNLVRKDARILHPLPKVNEINLLIEIEENDPRIAYFRQAENGLYIRMALLDFLINRKS